jgi:aryl-alcohol dehydrogenase-like predicted oxidoreductase
MQEKNDFSAASIKYALDNSLQRLQTDYIDCISYGQNAKPIILGKEDLKYKTMPGKITFMLFGHFGIFYKTRKIKHMGLSNETPWDSCVF